MKNKRKFKGIWIPAEVWESSELTLQEKVFLVEIDSLNNDNGCYANNNYFAKFFNLSTTRVSLVISSLINKGFVNSTILQSEGNKRILKTSLTKVNSLMALVMSSIGEFFNKTTSVFSNNKSMLSGILGSQSLNKNTFPF